LSCPPLGAAIAALYTIRHPDDVNCILMLIPFFVRASFNFDLAMLPTDTVRGNGVGLSDNMPSYSRWTRG